MIQEESSLVLLGKLASQYSELVMFTHLAGKIISPQMSQRLRVLATRANIVHEHLDVQCPTQIIDVIQAAFAATCTPLSPAKEAAVRSIFALAPLFIRSSSVTCSPCVEFMLNASCYIGCLQGVAAAPAPKRYTCEFRCGFGGAYASVAEHEKTCEQSRASAAAVAAQKHVHLTRPQPQPLPPQTLQPPQTPEHSSASAPRKKHQSVVHECGAAL